MCSKGRSLPSPRSAGTGRRIPPAAGNRRPSLFSYASDSASESLSKSATGVHSGFRILVRWQQARAQSAAILRRSLPWLSQWLSLALNSNLKPETWNLKPRSMRILLTNDDGIYAPGLEALSRELPRLGEVEVVAPVVEQ